VRSVRPERVASVIREEIASAILFESKDPGLKGISVTAVRVSADLRIAWVSYQVHDSSPGGCLAAQKGLVRATSYLRSCLRSRLRLRILPELRFEMDDRLDAAQRIEEILGEMEGSGGAGTGGRP